MWYTVDKPREPRYKLFYDNFGATFRIGKYNGLDWRNNPNLNRNEVLVGSDRIVEYQYDLLAKGKRLLGRPYGPYYTQAPLDFNPNSPGFLKDMSFMNPNEYNLFLDEYIRRNYKELTGADMRINFISEETRNIFKIWLWVLTKRTLVFGARYNGTGWLTAPLYESEYEEALENIRFFSREWDILEKGFISELLETVGTNPQSVDILNLYNNDPASRHNIRTMMIPVWADTNRKRN